MSASVSRSSTNLRDVVRLSRRARLALALAGLIGLSTGLQWFAGHRFHGLWIMPDEAIYAERALTIWRHGPGPLLRGGGAGYSLLYPLVAGVPLSIGTTATGLAALKLVQPLLMSLVALPIVLYGRRIMPPVYALIAAALALASPLLLYSGLVMTEVLFYPLAALTLLAVSRAVETATLRDQAIALFLLGATVLARTQAIVLVAVFAAAVLLDAALARDWSKLRAFWPVAAVTLAGAAVAVARPGVLGDYAVTVSGSYPLGAALRLTGDHLAYLILSTAVLPAVAFLLLLLDAVRGRERSPGGRALVSVTASAVLLVVVQVGFFASRFAPYLLGRNLAPLPPMLFVCFALWLARGGPRSRPIAAAVAFAVVAAIAAAPWSSLVVANAVPDTLDLGVLSRLRSHIQPATTVAFVGAVSVLLIAFWPRRFSFVLPAAALGVLVASSAVAANTLRSLVEYDQVNLVGTPPNWIDGAVKANVAYLYDGESDWNGVWQARFWNHRISEVVSVVPTRVRGPMQQRSVRVAPDGRFPIRERYVVASDLLQFIGTPIAHITQNGFEGAGLTLWKLLGTPRVGMIKRGIRPNGDMIEPGRITVYDCAGGQLRVTLLPKSTSVVTITLDGRTTIRQQLTGLPCWYGAVSVPASTEERICRFTIEGQTLLGSTRITFHRG